MEISELIEKDLNRLYKKVNRLGKVKTELYYKDFSTLSELSEMIYGKCLDNPFPFKKNYGLDLRGVLNNDKLYNLVYKCIKGYQNMNFKIFTKVGINLSPNEKEDLIRGFLEYLGTPFFDLYKSLRNDNRIFFVDKSQIYGESFCLPTLDSYYLCVSNKDVDDLDIIITIAHELAHIYSYRFLVNYRHSDYSLTNFLYRESLSLAFELLFYYYMLEHHIFPEIVRVNRNTIDTYILNLYKEIYYFFTAWGMDDTSIAFDGLQYTIEVDINIDDFKGKDYQFDNDYKNGDLENISYVVGNIRAHELCDSLLNTKDKIKVINEFLMTFQYEIIFQSEKLNPQIMLDGVRKRNRELRQIYKIK